MRFSVAGTLLLSSLPLLFLSPEAEAHGRYRYYGYRYYPAYYPAFYYGGFFPPPFYYPYPVHYGYADPGLSSIRIEVKPVEAEVYVDGYLAGVVDDFDGFFQRLQVRPGKHEILLYLDGHRTIRETLYLSPGSSYKIRKAMEPLPPGEAAEARPEPPPEAAATQPAPPPSAPVSGFGVLNLRVQPPGAEILIDGEPWSASGPSSDLAIHLSAGPHRIEIRKEGHEPFSTEVSVLPGKTIDLNVKLP